MMGLTATLPTPAKLKPNPNWAKPPLFDRKGWKTERSGEVVRQLEEETDLAPEGLERYVAGEHTGKENGCG